MVIAIISPLVTIGVPNLLEADTHSRIARAQSDMKTIVTALTICSTDHNGAYPPAPNDPSVSPLSKGSQQFPDNAGFHLTPPVKYLVNVPMSPFLHHAPPSVAGRRALLLHLPVS